MKTVLIVDDDDDLRQMMKHMLEVEGYRTLGAADGSSAIESVQMQAPDLVILDISMPQMNGIDTLREIKKMAPQLPVIMLTGYGDIPLSVRAMKLGAHDFLVKPPEFSNLIAIIKEAIGNTSACALSHRESQTLEWIKEGKSNFEIGLIMGISENTVRTYLKRIFTKFEVCSKAQAVAAAFECGILQGRADQK